MFHCFSIEFWLGHDGLHSFSPFIPIFRSPLQKVMGSSQKVCSRSVTEINMFRTRTKWDMYALHQTFVLWINKEFIQLFVPKTLLNVLVYSIMWYWVKNKWTTPPPLPNFNYVYTFTASLQSYKDIKWKNWDKKPTVHRKLTQNGEQWPSFILRYVKYDRHQQVVNVCLVKYITPPAELCIFLKNVNIAANPMNFWSNLLKSFQFKDTVNLP